MSHWFKRLYWRLEVLFRKERAEAELDEEIRYHLEREIEANLRAGMSPEEARRVAMADFGGVERTKEQVRDVRGGRMVDDLLQDLRYTIRGLIKRPGFTSVIVITLALGIGANTAIYSVLRNVVLRPFPYAEPDRLVTVWTPQIGYSYNPLSAPDWLDFREASESFEAWGVYAMEAVNLSGDAMPERVMGVRLTADLLRALGAVAARGRLFTEEETEDPVARGVIVSDGLWRSRFGADPELIGREILINRESWTVVGILSSDFRFPEWESLAEPGFLIPLSLGVQVAERGAYYLKVIGRLREGVSVERAEEELNAIAARLAEAYPETNDRRIAQVVPLRNIVLGDSGPRLWILLGVTGMVLLIACTNVAGLLMARNAGRNVEMAVRASMGAGRRRLLRQMLTESLVVALVGGTVGLVLAWWGIGMLGEVVPGNLPRVDQLRIDTLVVLFASGLALFTGVLFGIFPALTTSAVDLTGAFREGARTLTAGRSRTRFLGAMIIAQFALTFVLADAAALMLRSLWQATNSRELHEPGQVLIAGYLSPRERGEEIILPDPFVEQLRERLRSLPGVESVGISTHLPLIGGWTAGILAEGQDYDPEIDRGYVHMVCASPGYFDAIGIGLLRGRDLWPEDLEEGHLGVVVNRRFAEQSWPGQNPVGKRIRANSATPWLEAVVVGVVEDVRQSGLESRIEPVIYLPFFPPFMPTRWMALRSESEPMALVPALRRQLAELDPHLPLTRVFTAAQLYDLMATERRLTTQLIGLFALVALSLVAAGTYGVIAFQVRQRTHEMGVRVALGASRGGVVGLVLGRSLRLALLGIAVGLLGAFVASDVVGSLLYGVGPLDPAFLVGAALFLVLVAVSASAVPALRAVRIDPVEVMRAE
ncbi:MAG: ABC transporter permease [Gemmatimonadota bacterium]|nr:MAG: ABC transporter permease [Gemmatimonadota bacterium]